MSTTHILEAKNLCCYRGDNLLFDQLSFTIDAGALLQIKGENGTGKTTLLRAITGFTHLDEGEIYWKGLPIQHHREEFQHNLLFIGHLTGIKKELTAIENLNFYHALKNSSTHDLFEILSYVGLTGKEDIPVSQLSAGQQRRVALARLWLSEEQVWILDEPLTAIDKKGVALLESLFEKHTQQGGVILFTTHQDLSLSTSELHLTAHQRFA